MTMLVRLLALLTHFLGTAGFARMLTHSKAHGKEFLGKPVFNKAYSDELLCGE